MRENVSRKTITHAFVRPTDAGHEKNSLVSLSFVLQIESHIFSSSHTYYHHHHAQTELESRKSVERSTETFSSQRRVDKAKERHHISSHISVQTKTSFRASVQTTSAKSTKRSEESFVDEVSATRRDRESKSRRVGIERADEESARS